MFSKDNKMDVTHCCIECTRDGRLAYEDGLLLERGVSRRSAIPRCGAVVGYVLC